MIKLDKHFLKQSIVLQQSAQKMARDLYSCVYIEDVDTSDGPQRKYYCTNGHVLLFYKEAIKEKQLAGPIALNFKKLPATRKLYYDFELDNEKVEATVMNDFGEPSDVEINYIDTKHLRMDGFETVKRVLFEEKIKSFQKADQFILFSDEVIKVVKDYMGIGLFCQKPSVQDHYRQSSSPVFWHNSDCSMVAIGMPLRCGD